MQLSIAYRNTERSERIDALVEREVAKLPRFFDRIVSCRVLIDQPHRHHRKGAPFHVRIELAVPGEDLVVTSSQNPETIFPNDEQEAQRAVRDAFRRAERVLNEYARRKSGDVKTHAEAPEAKIVRLESDHGFLRGTDGHDVYFHRNSVLDGRFGDLEVGTVVRFVEEDGEDGPQASSVYAY